MRLDEMADIRQRLMSSDTHTREDVEKLFGFIDQMVVGLAESLKEIRGERSLTSFRERKAP